MPIPPIFAAINRVHSHFILMPAQVTHCAYGTCGFWAGTYIGPQTLSLESQPPFGFHWMLDVRCWVLDVPHSKPLPSAARR